MRKKRSKKLRSQNEELPLGDSSEHPKSALVETPLADCPLETASETAAKVLNEGILLSPAEPESNQEQTVSPEEVVAGDRCVALAQDMTNAKEKDQTNRKFQEKPVTAAVPESETPVRDLAVPDRFGDIFVFFVLIYFCMKWLSESEFSYDFL